MPAIRGQLFWGTALPRGGPPRPIAGAAAAAGFIVPAPLARVPENTMKFIAGVVLTAFGAFWSVEGAHAHWPVGDAACSL